MLAGERRADRLVCAVEARPRADEPPAAPPPPEALPGSLAHTPMLDSWIRVDADGAITVFTGKAELGQGLKTALMQLAAEQLTLAPARIELVTADTGRTPNEGYTAGSHSMQDSGTAIFNAGGQVRALLMAAAAAQLRPPGRSTASPRRLRFMLATAAASATARSSPDSRCTCSAQPQRASKDPTTYRIVGTRCRGSTFPAKVTGGVAYVQDMRLPGMLHARVVRPPSSGARLRTCDTDAIEKMSGVVKVVRDGNYLAVVAERELQAIKAMRALSQPRAMAGERASLPEAELDASMLQTRCRRATSTVLTWKRSAGRAAVKRLEARYHATVSVARLDRSVLRRGAVRRRRRDGLDAYAGRLPRPAGDRRDAADAAASRCAASTSRAPAATATTAPTMPPPTRR